MKGFQKVMCSIGNKVHKICAFIGRFSLLTTLKMSQGAIEQEDFVYTL